MKNSEQLEVLKNKTSLVILTVTATFCHRRVVNQLIKINIECLCKVLDNIITNHAYRILCFFILFFQKHPHIVKDKTFLLRSETQKTERSVD